MKILKINVKYEKDREQGDIEEGWEKRSIREFCTELGCPTFAIYIYTQIDINSTSWETIACNDQSIMDEGRAG